MQSFRLEIAFNFVLQLVQFIFPFIVLALASNELSPAEFVDVASLTYLISLQIVIIGFGFEQVCTRLIAEAEGSTWSLVASSVVKLQLCLWAITVIILMSVALLTDRLGFMVYASLIGGFSFAIAPPWLAMALGLNQHLVLFNSLVRVVVLAVICGLPPSVMLYATGIIAVALASSIYFLFAANRSGLELSLPTVSDSLACFSSLWAQMAVAFFARLGVVGYTTFIPLGLSAAADPKLVQLYMISDKLRNIIQYGVGALLPVFNRFYLDRKADRNRLELLYSFGFIAMLGICFLTVRMGDQILSLFNMALEESAIFSILIFSVVAIYLTNFFGVLKVFHSGYPILYSIPLVVSGMAAISWFPHILDRYGAEGVAWLVFLVEFSIACLYAVLQIFIARVKN